MTTTNSKLQSNIQDSMDLIYESLQTQSAEITKELGKNVVAIYFDDISSYGLTPLKFLKMVRVLETQIEGLKLVKGYDEDALMHWGNVGDESVPEPPVCIVKLPDGFEANFFNDGILKADGKSVSQGKQISKLTFVGTDDATRYKIIINDDYSKVIEVDKTKSGGAWAVLWAVVNGGQRAVQKHKEQIDYLNYNSKCALYSKTGYATTKILAVKMNNIVTNVAVEMVSTTALAKRIQKLKRT